MGSCSVVHKAWQMQCWPCTLAHVNRASLTGLSRCAYFCAEQQPFLCHGVIPFHFTAAHGEMETAPRSKQSSSCLSAPKRWVIHKSPSCLDGLWQCVQHYLLVFIQVATAISELLRAQRPPGVAMPACQQCIGFHFERTYLKHLTDWLACGALCGC